MEPNEMMVNEEVVETATEATEEIVKKSSGKGFKIAAGVGLVIVIGGLAVKYVIIPAANKIKAKKQQSFIPMKRIPKNNRKLNKGNSRSG